MTDFKTLKLSWKPNQHLVTPAGWGPSKPHRESPVYERPASEVYDAIKAVAIGEPRVQVISDDPAKRKLKVVQRTRVIRFPDYVSIEIASMPDGKTTVLVYSRARFGIRDFGVNRRRIDRWLGLLATRLGRAS